MVFSVIIPTLNEAHYILPTLKSVYSGETIPEVILADGGSTDKTLHMASQFPVKIIHAEKGRGTQLNCGAANSSGDILIFLHADTLFPHKGFSTIRHVFQNRKVKIGLFHLAFDINGFLPRVYSWCTRFESLLTSFGDQCIVMRKSFFNTLRGFPETLIFEDVVLLRKARQKEKIYKLHGSVISSARMFKKNGFIKQQLKNGYLLIRYLTGTSPEAIYRKYYKT